jgi:putative DNA primase/helicase
LEKKTMTDDNVVGLHKAAADLPLDDTEIDRLAQLSTLDYEREREPVAKRLSIRLPVLDELVAIAKLKTAGQPSLPFLPAVETAPWPEPVNGAQLLDKITASIRRYVVLDKGAAEATALWIVHTYCFDAFAITPRLAITSAVMRCGKTTLLDVLSCLVHRPISTANATAAAIYRVVDKLRPTILMDEADTFLVDNAALRGILNSGYRRNTAFVMRADETFSTWAPAAIAMIGRLPSTLEDRSISNRLQRRRADEPVEVFRLGQQADLKRLARMAARFAADHFDELKGANPNVPVTLENREADNWLPLIAIGDAAGGAWPGNARQVAEHLAHVNRATEQSKSVMLLEDIHALLPGFGGKQVPSADLVKALAQLEDRPWAEWKGAKVITQNAIAHLLAPFNIKPFEMRMGSRVVRGYRAAQFEDAFARYVEAARVQSATPLQTGDPESSQTK